MAASQLLPDQRNYMNYHNTPGGIVGRESYDPIFISMGRNSSQQTDFCVEQSPHTEREICMARIRSEHSMYSY